MMDPREMERLVKEAAANAQRHNRKPWVPGTYLAEKPAELDAAARKMPFIGDYRPLDWELVPIEQLKPWPGMREGRLNWLACREPYLMVDNSGLGSESEPSLTHREVVALMMANPLLGFAVVEAGQFQVVMGVFRKLDNVASPRCPWKDTAGVAEAFVARRAAKTDNADSDGKRYRLHATNIAEWTEDGCVMFDWGGWYTPTTARHMNAILKALGADKRVAYGKQGGGEATFMVQP